MSLKITNSDKTGWTVRHRDPPGSASVTLGLQACTITLEFYVGVGGPNSSPHGCPTNPYNSYILSYNYADRNLWCILFYMNNIFYLFVAYECDSSH